MRRAALGPQLLLVACVIGEGDDSGDATTPSSSSPATSAASDDASATGGSEHGTSTGGVDPSVATTATTDPTSPTSADASTETGTGASSDDGTTPTGGGTIDVTLSGCDIDFGGTVVVSYNGSLGVASVYDGGASLTGSFQFDMLALGAIELSSQHRVDTGMVVNMVDTTSTWTNLDADALVSGVDTISGTLTVDIWNPARGESALAFDDVTLRNVVDGGLCTINGTIETTELYP